MKKKPTKAFLLEVCQQSDVNDRPYAPARTEQTRSFLRRLNTIKDPRLVIFIGLVGQKGENPINSFPNTVTHNYQKSQTTASFEANNKREVIPYLPTTRIKKSPFVISIGLVGPGEEKTDESLSP